MNGRFKGFLVKIRNLILFAKVCLARSMNYLAIINSGMVLFLLLSRLKEAGRIDLNLQDYFLLVALVGFIGLVLIGWFDIRVLKGLQAETTILFGYRPQMVSMKKKVDFLSDQERKRRGGE